MGKRSAFERNPRDFYPTPRAAVLPLLDHVPKGSRFTEPCAGDGALVRHLESFGLVCHFAYDIEPQADGIVRHDVFEMGRELCGGYGADLVITNPPWDRDVLHPMIETLSFAQPSWLLFDSDWAYTRQGSRFMPWLRKIVSVGRVKWIPGSKMTGKDNCSWYLFDQNTVGPVEFVGRSK